MRNLRTNSGCHRTRDLASIALLCALLAAPSWAQESPAPRSRAADPDSGQFPEHLPSRAARSGRDAAGAGARQSAALVAADFEISRGVTTLTEAEARAAGMPAGSGGTPSTYVRIRKDFPENALLTDAQYSLSVEGS